jgi:hypothetical protein
VSGVGPEKAKPGNEGTTRSNAIVGSRPCRFGSLRGPRMSRGSVASGVGMIEEDLVRDVGSCSFVVAAEVGIRRVPVPV